jgi:hypothetical protein
MHLLQQMQNLPDIIKKKGLATGLGKFCNPVFPVLFSQAISKGLRLSELQK